MSQSADAHHTHDHEAHHGDEDEGYHATLGGYIKGFILSVILTAIPFALVMLKLPVSPRLVAGVIVVFAAVQMIVHIVFFLHLDERAEGGWNLLATIFTVALVFIMLAGSVWVMYHMNANMMPTMDPATMRNMP